MKVKTKYSKNLNVISLEKYFREKFSIYNSLFTYELSRQKKVLCRELLSLQFAWSPKFYLTYWGRVFRLPGEWKLHGHLL